MKTEITLREFLSRYTAIPEKFINEYPLNDYRCFNTYGVRDAIQPENAVFGRYPHNQDLRIF